jgi:hypothetical protein
VDPLASATTVADADLLLPFAEALVQGNVARLAATRARLAANLGSAALVDTAATIAIFNAVVKIADATGIPVEDYKVDLTANDRKALGIDDYGVPTYNQDAMDAK